LKYPGITPSGKLPAMIFFPLFKSTPEENFDIIVIGDPQTANSEEIGFFRDNIVAGLMGTDARFYLALGDILYNDLSLYNQMHQVVGQIGIPVHHVIGNHDMNFQVPDHIHEAETFKRFHGPDYYSFNYGKVHFVILNSIKYNGWNQKENKAGRYTGYLHDKQLTWLKNDLAFVPQDHLVVFAMHIPVFSELYPQDDYSQITNRPEFFRILENRQYLLALAGHMHFVDYLEFTPVHGWHGKAIFPSLTAGAGCGTWWHGPKNPHGIPFGLCTDGAPNGYFCFSFTGNKYRYKFCPAAPSAGMQMRINSPIGTLSFQDFKEGKISVNVNVFTGTPQTTVAFSLDNGLEINMERMVMKDPFFSKLIEMNKTCYLDWMEPTLSTHTWSATLPNGLTPGIHRLKVTAADSQGNMFSDYCLFEIPTESQKPNF
jgi:hypothetical protein